MNSWSVARPCSRAASSGRNERMRRGNREGEPVFDHYRETQSIDFDLKKAAKTLPTKWWSLPKLKGVEDEHGA